MKYRRETYRTDSGQPSADAKREYGIKVNGDYAYPVFDVRSALSAIKLRHNSSRVSAAKVLRHVSNSRYAGDKRVKEALKKARETDKKR